MSLVNAYYPDTSYLLTRRIKDRYFYLTPKFDDIAPMVGYAMAYAAKKHNITVFAYSSMSNHTHLTVHDNEGNLPLFMRDMNRMIAVYINKKFGLTENVWSTQKPGFTILPESQDVLDKILYTLLNPVQAGLVDDHENWPGLMMKPRHILRKKVVFKRPKQHFSKNTKFPKEVELEIGVPEGFRGITKESYVQYLEERIKERQKEIKISMGNRKFLGRRRVKSFGHTYQPKTDPGKRKLNPRVAGKNREILIMWKIAIREFRIAYKAAWEEYKRGNRNVVFPYGTYKMRIEHNVIVA